MKHVRLKELTLINWRGERRRTTEFADDATTIAGRNGLGKSRHFDAFMWLLFGKDSNDRKDYNVKTIVAGEPLQKTNAEVVGVLDVEGERITLRRVLVERWVKPRGQTEQVFKGNETECYWNDTPVSVGEYQKRMGEIIDDSVFKMITNPLYFVGMPWRAQRDQLFQMAGVLSDEDIARDNADFRGLLDKLTGKSLSDFKRELSARKRKLKADLDEIQPRIDQTQKMMPEEADWEALEAEVSSIEAELAEVDRAIASEGERMRIKHEARLECQGKIAELKAKRQGVLLEAQTKAKEEVHRANAERRELEEKIDKVRREARQSEADVATSISQIEKSKKLMQDLKTESDALREQWYRENEAEYKGETICKCCGQELPEGMKAEAKALFERNKQEKLKQITQGGKSLKLEMDNLERFIAEYVDDRDRSKVYADGKREELIDLETRLSALAKTEEAQIKGEDLEEYLSISDEITALEKEAKDEETEMADDREYQTRKKELTGQRDEAKARLSDRGRIEQFKRQIGSLEDEGRAIAQQIAEAEQEEFTIAQFTKAKVDEAEKRINALFSRVTFKLFDYTIEDSKRENPIETCEPLVDGVPFSTTNTAGQVNAGLDIINALTRFWGITAPIFIDGRESVNEIIPTPSQIINLKVTDDKELVIK